MKKKVEDSRESSSRAHPCASVIALAILLIVPALFDAAEPQIRKEVYGGYLHPKDRYHYDLHDIEAGQRVCVSLGNVSGNLDPFLRISLGDFSIEDDDSGPGSDAVVEFVAPQSGTYDIEISPFQNATFGEYALTVEYCETTRARSSGPMASLDVQRSHPSLAVQELLGSLNEPGEFYEHELVHLNAGHTLYIFAEPLTPGLDLEVQLKDFQQKILSDVLPDAETHLTKIEFPISEAADHYALMVKATDGQATGDYRVLLGIDAPEVLNGKGGVMPTFANLTDSDIDAVINYLQATKSATSGEEASSEHHGAVVAGEGLYLEHCAGCHGVDSYSFVSSVSEMPAAAEDAIIRNAISNAQHFGGDPIISQPREIRVGFELQQITEIDQQNERFGVVGVFRAEWTDHALAFDASDYQTTKLTYADRQLVSFLEQDEIDWPDFRILNQQTKQTQHRVLNIDSDGHVLFEERFAATLQAPEFDFRKFPFDYQDFWLRIETRAPATFAKLALHGNPDFNRVGAKLGEEEWVIHEAIPLITDADGHYRFSLDIRAKRHTTYYIFRILFPLGLIVLVGWGIFFIFDHNTQIAAASANLLVFIAFNFTVGDSLPRLGYLTFLDSIMIIGFVAAITSLLLALYLKRIEADGRAEDAKAMERHALLIMPLSFSVLITVSVVYFFIML